MIHSVFNRWCVLDINVMNQIRKLCYTSHKTLIFEETYVVLHIELFFHGGTCVILHIKRFSMKGLVLHLMSTFSILRVSF